MGLVVLPDILGYIPRAENPLRLARVLRILHEALLSRLAPSLGGCGQKVLKNN